MPSIEPTSETAVEPSKQRAARPGRGRVLLVAGAALGLAFATVAGAAAAAPPQVFDAATTGVADQSAGAPFDRGPRGGGLFRDIT
ncbi:MAG: hypothetical protein WEC14_04480, partial [Chloroflexota bacterium]